MKRHITASLLVVVLGLNTPNALACPTPPSGPYSVGSSLYWYDYTPDPSCVVAYGSPSPQATTLWCYNEPAWSTGTGWANVSYTFTIGANDPVLSSWSADVLVEFNDPNDSFGNGVQLWATVTHNGSTSYTLLAFHDGSMGDLSCDIRSGGFSATYGDQVTIDVYSYKSNSTTQIEVSVPHIYTTNS